MKDIYVVAHAESVHHTENKVGGWYDTSLTELGSRQARAIAARLVDLVGREKPVITCSDLKRTSETAELIAQSFQCGIHRTADLRELSAGQAEGKPQEWLDARFQPAPEDNRLDHRSIEGGETKREFSTRIYRAMDDIVASAAPQHIVVTHGYALTFVMARWIRLPLESAGHVNFRSSSGGITHLHEDDFLRNRAVRFHNCTSHLTGL